MYLLKKSLSDKVREEDIEINLTDIDVFFSIIFRIPPSEIYRTHDFLFKLIMKFPGFIKNLQFD